MGSILFRQMMIIKIIKRAILSQVQLLCSMHFDAVFSSLALSKYSWKIRQRKYEIGAVNDFSNQVYN